MGASPSTATAVTGSSHVHRTRKGRRASLMRPAFDVLPHEVFSNVKKFLLGPDLFKLSHVNRRLRQLLQNPEIWAQRMANYDFNPWMYKQYLEQTAKMRYAQGRSLQFPGVTRDSKRVGMYDRGGSVALPRIVRSFHHDPISFDVWFSLLPAYASEDGRRVFTGGVLFGSQSQPPYARVAPMHHEHVIHVDTEGNLYCSLMWQKPIVASKLEYNRWYHVALSFDGEEQRVYVDGELCHIDSSRQLTAWSDLPYAQVGTGRLGVQSPGKPFADYHGWYGFFGVIDDFRIWNSALTLEQVVKLARGQFVKSSPSYRLKRGIGTTTCGRVHTVRCTRPVERVLEIIPWTSRRKKLHKWLSKVKKSSTEGASCISMPA